MRSPAISLLPIGIDRMSSATLQHQIFEGIQSAILDGRLPPGARLPSSRLLARELTVSRNTVLHAFEMLASEGYTEAESGSATRVSSVLPETLQIPPQRDKRSAATPNARRLSDLARPGHDRQQDIRKTLFLFISAHRICRIFRSRYGAGFSTGFGEIRQKAY